MRVGVTLPQFHPDVAPSLTAARAAEAVGLDGVFVFDHVWAIGNPRRPAQSAWPLLGALAAETTIHVGSLVARVGLLPNAVLAHNFETLHRIAGDRLIAGLGSGDHLSEEENVAVDVPFAPAQERLAALADACRRTRALGIETWVGGLSRRIERVAADEDVTLNLWGVTPERCAAASVAVGSVTWGGPVPATAEATADLLRGLAAAGVRWAVCAPPYVSGGVDTDPVAAVEMLAEALATLR